MIIIDDIEQGSEEWRKLRAGIPTASCFNQILTPLGKSSTQATGYMIRLIAEKYSSEEVDQYTNGWMERGKELESEARIYYELTTDVWVQQVGLIYLDETRQVACSPDGLVGELGGLEIKCLKAENHIEAYLAGVLPTKHIPQVQGNLWISGRAWWDLLLYHPIFKKLTIHVERDQAYIDLLASSIKTFLQEMAEMEEKIIVAIK